ncbi:MAG: AI-2E family transporter [bacterium]
MALPPTQGDARPARRRMLPKQSQVFFFLIMGLFLFLTWLIFRNFIIYIMTGVFVAVLALPIDKFWERFFRNRVAAGFTMMTLLLILTVPLILLGISMANDVTKLANAVQHGEIEQMINGTVQKPWVDKLVAWFHPDANLTARHAYVAEQAHAAQNWVVDELQNIGSGLLAAIPDLFVGISVILVVVYYVLTDGEAFVAYLRRALPIPARQVDFLLKEARGGLQAVFFGQILAGLMQGVLGGIGWYFAGLPNAVLWGFVMAIMALLPVVGTNFIWGPGGLYLIFVKNDLPHGVFLLVYGFFIVMVMMDNLVKPKLIGKRADIHPMFVLVGVLGGATAFGFIGLFLGPLLMGVTIAVLKVYESDYLDPEVNLVDEMEFQAAAGEADPDTAPPASP